MNLGGSGCSGSVPPPHPPRPVGVIRPLMGHGFNVNHSLRKTETLHTHQTHQTHHHSHPTHQAGLRAHHYAPPFHEHEFDRKRRFSRTPWILMGARRLPGVLGLHQEIEDFYAWMLPTTLEHNLRLDVVERIRVAINDLYPAARVEISGSFRTGLYLPTSDIDLVICGRWESLPLRTIERILLEKKIAYPDSLRVLDKAAVPIVKLTDIRSDIKVDISFNMSNGVRAAELIKHFKKRYPSLPKLIYVLKQFLLQRDLNEVFTGGLSSYSLILLVISYLQHHYSQETASSGSANLGVMLIEILELYGRNFNFMNTAIRITDGGSYISKTKFQRAVSNGYAPALLSIEDPLDPTNDVGRSSYGFVAVQNSFERAFAVLTSLVVAQTSVPDGKSILSSIVEIPEDVSEYRCWMREQFPFLGVPHNNFQLFPAVPPQYYRAPLEFVSPRELPPTSQFTSPATAEAKAEVKSRSSPIPSPPPPIATNDLSDCLSSVSTCPSQSSPLDSLSDTDSDVLIGGPTLTPHSAMSISPANSEIGGSMGKLESLKGSLSRDTPKRSSSKSEHAPQKRCPSSSSNSSRASGKQQRSEGNNFKYPPQSKSSANSRNNTPCSSNKHSHHNKEQQQHPNRCLDSVLNWRSPERRKKAVTGGSSSGNEEASTLPPLPHPTSSEASSKPSSSRADRDSNWREREASDKNGNTSRIRLDNQDNNSITSSSNNLLPNSAQQPPANNHQPPGTPPFTSSGASSNGTLTKQKKKHKKNHQSKSKYVSSTKVKENNEKVHSEAHKEPGVLKADIDEEESTPLRSNSSNSSSPSGGGSGIMKSSLKKRKKCHSKTLGDESKQQPPTALLKTDPIHSSSRFSPKAPLGSGKR